MGLRVAAAAALTAAMLAGCGPGSAPARGGAPSTSAGRTATSAPPGGGGVTASPKATSPARQSGARLCGPPEAPAQALTVHAAGGVRLQAAVAGSGKRGVVLIPELGAAGMCGWWPYAARLASSGYHVLIFSHRCVDGSSCPANPYAQAALMPDIAAVVAALRKAGATRIVLMGASQGASEALIAGTAPLPGVTGVVSLSADENTSPLGGGGYPPTALAAAPRLTVPALFAVAAGDPYVSVTQTRHLFAVTGSRSKKLMVLPATWGHGWDLVISMLPGRARMRFAAVLSAFLRQATA